MRLLTKTTLYFLIAMVPMLAAAGIYLFHQFSRELNARADEELVNDEIQWIQYLQTTTEFGTSFILRTRDISIFPVNDPVTAEPAITDGYGFEARQKTQIPFRQLYHVVPINGIAYQISIRKSQEQKLVLVANLTRLMLLVFIGLFVATLLFNWFISRKLWEPFRRSLEKIRGAELDKMQNMHFETTNIKEFNELNGTLNAMTHKIYHDYENMKEFTENAAHEMQTPLAVAQSKIELLLQDSNLKPQQIEWIMQAGESLNRLSKLNQSLLLLAKIENNQYGDKTTISFTAVIKKYLQLFDEMIRDKQLLVETGFSDDFEMHLHPLLADSLVSNLVGNAIKYNISGGKIMITLTNSRFSIANTSSISPIDPQQLFKRFIPASADATNSTGLGLAIVKKIAGTNNLTVNYYSENGIHEFTIEKTGAVN